MNRRYAGSVFAELHKRKKFCCFYLIFEAVVGTKDIVQSKWNHAQVILNPDLEFSALYRYRIRKNCFSTHPSSYTTKFHYNQLENFLCNKIKIFCFSFTEEFKKINLYSVALPEIKVKKFVPKFEKNFLFKPLSRNPQIEGSKRSALHYIFCNVLLRIFQFTLVAMFLSETIKLIFAYLCSLNVL